MIGDPPSIKAFKTSITPENVKFFWDSDRDNMKHYIISLSFESDILHKFFPASFHAATDEETPQKISPQDTLDISATICADLLSFCLRW